MEEQKEEEIITKEDFPMKRSNTIGSPEKSKIENPNKVEEINEHLKRSVTLSTPNNNDDNNQRLTDRLIRPAIAYQEATLERKKEAYNIFKKWEEKRAALLSKHRSHLEAIIFKLDTRSTLGIQSLEAIIKFFKDRITQEEAYQKCMDNSLPKLGNFFKDIKVEESTQGILPKVFHEFDDYHIKHARNSRSITEFMSTTILNEILEWFKKEYINKVDSFRSSIADKKKKLLKVNKEAQQKANEYADFCIKMFKIGLNDKSKDFYDNELKFLHLAKNQMNLESELGKEIMEYFDNLKKLETSRFDIIKRAISKYLAKMGEIYGKGGANNPEVIIKILETLQINDEIDKFFTVKTFIENEDDIKFIKSYFPDASELTLLHLKTYVESFDYKQSIRSPLAIKQWKASRDLGLIKGTKNYKVIATVDYNLILIEDKPEFIKPEKIMKMSNLKLMLSEKKDMNIVDILEVVPGLILDSKNKISLKFENEDAVEEFIHFMNNYEVIKDASSK